MSDLYFAPSTPHDHHDTLPIWRELIFKRLFGLLAILCVPVYITSVYLCIQMGLIGMAAFDTLAYLLLLYILLARGLRQSLRYCIGCLMFFAIGVAFLITIGPTGAGFFWLFVFPPLTSILIGKKASLCAQLLNAAALTSIGVAYHNQWFQWPETQGYNGFIWSVVAINFIVTNAMVTQSAAFLLGKLTHSLRSTTASRRATVMGLAKLAEYRDNETGAHLIRMQHYAKMLATQRQTDKDAPTELTDDFIQEITLSSILHDIGKVGIADAILLKPGRLTPEEFEQIKAHPVIGAQVLESLLSYAPECAFIKMGRDIAGGHHEWWDGSGYPAGLKGEAIPLSARIVALVDVYDALTSPRCYKRPFSHQEAMDLICQDKGTHFDPKLVDSFMAINNRFELLSRASLFEQPLKQPLKGQPAALTNSELETSQ
ncbi:HD domain-containing phosphohydrolase [Shewanella sp. Isolate8]|uniref:HD-GYP domain-containing protein n=1 Tax=Shewanella sp. Isolate8 TaxID=2908529 RepID=UPI001EFD6BEA|nr:HD domain-containing phosphohydrolase [Shewanella sp. Isolate8]MCG9746400.1 HD domain-containing protein [Shewanella sp. Isolate8]